MCFSGTRETVCLTPDEFFFLRSTTVEYQIRTRFSVRPSVRPSVPYVTQPMIFQCMSYSPVFSNVCHTAQNSPAHVSPMYVTQPSFLQCMSHTSVFSMNESWTTLLLNPTLPKDESLWSSQWCLIRTHHNYPLNL